MTILYNHFYYSFFISYFLYIHSKIFFYTIIPKIYFYANYLPVLPKPLFPRAVFELICFTISTLEYITGTITSCEILSPALTI